MSQQLLAKKRQITQTIQATQIRRQQLLESIRNTPDFFNQFLAHVGVQKVQDFLDKALDYKDSKRNIEKLQEEYQIEELKDRQLTLKNANIPETFKRACLSPICAICINKHEWTKVLMLTCGHVFHGQCLKQLQKNECPQCRAQIQLPKQRHGALFHL